MPTFKTAAIGIAYVLVALVIYDLAKPSINKMLGRA